MKHVIIFFSFLSGISAIMESILDDRCCQISYQKSPRFDLVKLGARSTLSVILKREVSNLESCKQFAISRNAMAFNFRPKETTGLQHSGKYDPYYSNCIILYCPELSTFSSLVNDARFKYYSIYAYHDQRLGGNLTCVPGLGLFMFSEEHLNYTDAQLACQKLNGILAHVISEKRTNELAKFIDGSATFVGLSNRDTERIWKNELDDPLTCFEYRGWGLGEPQHLQGCVGLVHLKDRSIALWKVLPCDLPSPYICEILPKYQSHRQKKI